MVARVAKAIGEALYGYCDPVDTPNTYSAATTAARAAIAEMRQPTDDMIAVGRDMEFERDNPTSEYEMIVSYRVDADATAIWQTMIDAALNAKNPPRQP